tara:strand:+ start:2165 stop:2974 length:810 start_codon:yes stop_codon:yes gene_type:complete
MFGDEIMITLDGTHGWVISYTNKHNISGKVVESINTGDWTFCTSVKPEWNPDKLTLNIDDKGYRGGILVRNGRHSGLFNVLWPTETGDGWLKFIKGEIWYDTPKGGVKIALLEKRVFGDGWIDIIISYNREKSMMIFSMREEGQVWDTQVSKLDGEIIDYTGSHVWIGCANAFESCPEPQFYSGHIRCLGVFNSVLSEKDRDKFYKEYHDFKGIPKYFRSNAHKRQVYNFEKMNPLAFTNFKTTTPYKAFDFSGNGNHPIIYKREWGVY